VIAYIVRRTLALLVSSFLLITIIFFTIRAMAGDPAMACLGDNASTEAIASLREKWGLNKPIWEQYSNFIWNLLHLDLGKAYSNDQPVSELLARALPHTLALTLAFILGALIIGIPIGLITALRQNSWLDYLGRLLSLGGISLPPFYVGVLLLLAFAVKLKWFPVMGGGMPGNLADQLYHLVLPGLAGALYLAAYVTRFVRTAMLEVLRQDYMTTARSKGVSERVVILKHGLRNALIPLVTVIGLYFALLLGGSVLIEQVFFRPGLGRLLINAIDTRDYILLQSMMVVYVVLVGVINLAVDLSYGFIDPRIRYT